MLSDFVLPLSDAQATLAKVGGKGASLARLVAAGLPVPEGFCVTTAAYQGFVADNHLEEGILAAVAVADPARPATLEEAARLIGERFAQGVIPSAVGRAISEAYADLGRKPAVAVRSSATAEDLPGLSFAGQQETYLNVHGQEAVLQAVRKCWSSLWTARAIGYRAQHGIDPAGVRLAVVVQRLVCADSAGVLFTTNPLTGRRDEAMITAAWGLGEAIVGGLVTPDTLRVEERTGRILGRETADKRVMTVPGDEGTREQPTPEQMRRAPVLEDCAVAELVRLGRQVESLYGSPMDIEWARAEGKFMVLQARPITALPEPEAPIPTEWPLPGKGPFYRGSIVDFLPGPVSPLFATLGRDRYNAGEERLMEWFIGDKRARMAWLNIINGYAYISVTLSAGALLRILLALRRLPFLIRDSVSRWRNEAVPHYQSVVADWQARPPPGRSGAELLRGVREIYDAAIDHLTTLQAGLIGGAGLTEALYTWVYEKLVRRPGDPAAPVLMLGYESTPIQAEEALFDLSRWIGGQASLADHVRSRPTLELIAELANPEPPVGMGATAWGELRVRWRAHLERYGGMIYNLDFAWPLPADEPGPLLEALKLDLSGRGINPHERQQQLAARREEAKQSVLRRLRGPRRRLFATVLGWAQSLAPLREDGIAFVGHGYPQLRCMLKELGERIARAGALESPEGIFWLTESEIEEAIANLDRGERPESKAVAVRERQAVWRARKRLSPPPVLPPTRRFFLGRLNMGGILPERGNQRGDTLVGTAASPGRVMAPACVLHGPEDFDQMRPGLVLVAEITTPAWTPLFAMAAAVVTDVGGPLSHGSIVAREYGIPAVMGTGVATQRVRAGQIITVDGDAGTVELPPAEIAVTP